MNDFTKAELDNLREALNKFPSNKFYFGDEVIPLRDKVRDMVDNYCQKACSHHELVRLKLLNEKEYDFCETCLFVRRMR